MAAAASLAVLVVHEPALSRAGVTAVLEALRGAGLAAGAHALSPSALTEDRAGLAELDGALAALRAATGAPETAALLGLGRGGTLAFLFACTRRLELVVDVEGHVLHPALSRARPAQPLELALNLEGAFLGLFGAGGPVGEEERGLLAERLTAAARPFELAVLPGGEIVVDPENPGYDGGRARELWRRVVGFLRTATSE